MLQGAHVFSHQAFGHNDPSWIQGHHQTHHAQQAAAQAATSMAHAQHYNRIAANHNSGPSHSSSHGQESSMMDGVTEENRRVLGWIADLLNEETRESALLELSKKREQVPELALILWHSFGEAHSYSSYVASC
jgi:CCR4-NOT transcription complex subunit 9